MPSLSSVLSGAVVLLAMAAVAAPQQAVQPRMGAPLVGLNAAEQARFAAGKNAFEHIQSLAEGLGPIMNGDRCRQCHVGPAVGGGSTAFATRFGVMSTSSSAFDPLIAFGGPVRQRFSIQPPTCDEVVPTQADVEIRRITPPTFGLGLVEAILDADILLREAFPPPGVSGRAHMVTPAETPLGPLRVGRFGWKSQAATLLTFSADASVSELGISNRLFPLDNAPNGVPTVSQPCDNVLDPEDGPDAQGFHKIDRMSDFIRFLAAPPQTPRSGMIGEATFIAIGCANCHVSQSYTTIPTATDAALANRALKPYTDFLLHDVGTGDGIAEGMASEFELRTPPLWGVGFRAQTALLHDGSATGAVSPEANLHTAIVAHGNEAATTVAAYSSLGAIDQLRVQRFLMSLGRMEFDIEFDNNVDTFDWLAIRPLVTGPGVYFTADSLEAVADFDQDGDFDLHDIAGLQRAYTGP